MTTPYIKHKAGDFITAEDWNKMQIRAREDIEKKISEHDHTCENKDGQKIKDNGVKLSGKAIDPSSELCVKEINVTNNIKVKDGFIVGHNPLYDKSKTERDQEAVKILKDEPGGTFLLAGPGKKDEGSSKPSFSIYWKEPEGNCIRFDTQAVSMSGAFYTIDQEGKSTEL